MALICFCRSSPGRAAAAPPPAAPCSTKFAFCSLARVALQVLALLGQLLLQPLDLGGHVDQACAATHRPRNRDARASPTAAAWPRPGRTPACRRRPACAMNGASAGSRRPPPRRSARTRPAASSGPRCSDCAPRARRAPGPASGRCAASIAASLPGWRERRPGRDDHALGRRLRRRQAALEGRLVQRLPDRLGHERHDRLHQPQDARRARRPARAAPAAGSPASRSRPLLISTYQSQNSDQVKS